MLAHRLEGFRAERVEGKVWEPVRSLMLELEHLRDAINAMIEEERNAARGNPEIEAKAWLEKIAAAERKRNRFQDMGAEGLITLDELREKLACLDDLRKTAEKELRAIEVRKEALQQLERDRDSLMEHYANMAPDAFGSLTPEERYQPYRILRLRVTAGADRNLMAEGVFGEALSVQDGTSMCVMPFFAKVAQQPYRTRRGTAFDRNLAKSSPRHRWSVSTSSELIGRPLCLSTTRANSPLLMSIRRWIRHPSGSRTPLIGS